MQTDTTKGNLSTIFGSHFACDLASVLKSVLVEVLQDDFEVPVTLKHPKEEDHGDYASSVALQVYAQVLSRGKFKTPREVAEVLKEKLLQNEEVNRICQKVEVASPGFLNFYLKKEVLVEELEKILVKGEEYGKNERLKGCKVMVEYTDPNPFKEFHIGHLYSNAVGESLARLAEKSSGEVRRANYQGDVGMHVAKSIWGMKTKLTKEQKTLDDLEQLSLQEKAKFLGAAYALGATAFEENEAVKEEVRRINKQVYAKDEAVLDYYQRGRQWSLDYFETIYKRLGTKFDFYFFESVVGPVGVEYIRQNLSKGVFEKSDEAIVFKGEQYGLHTRVFINSQGLPTYEAKDLGLATIKYQKYAYDRSIIVTANEVDEYFKVILKALELINPELAAKTTHISHGVVKLPGGKISSRKGNVLTGEWLLEAVKALVTKKMEESGDAYTKDLITIISEIVAVGAVKYALLKSSIGKDITFDLEKSVSLEGNSGPYIQYTYARCRSVLKKSSQSMGVNRGSLTGSSSFKDYQLNPEETALIRWIYRFPEVVFEASANFSPSVVCTFLYELCQRFNTFYNKHQILSKEEMQTVFRLRLTVATAQILKNGLYVLGIKAPEKM
ncbi:MAG: arginine--tRNA ligase [Patescibacteria group bacterium]